MGRRGVMSMSKMVLPTVSWVAVMRLLKKVPKSLPASRPGMGAEMALKAFLGCSAAPQTHSLRYADDFLAHTKGRRGGGRRPKPATLIPGCTSTPHTDSFRVHHVVNQEALQLMLSFHDDDDDADTDFDYEAFFESDEHCSGIIRDGDRLLHDDIYADDSAGASSSMGTCSSRLSAATSRSLVMSRNSVDSEGVYSTATSASFGNTPSSPRSHNIGPHITCSSTPSSSIISSCRASELIYSDAILDHDLKLRAREELEQEELQQLGAHDVEEEDAYSAYSDWNEAHESKMDQTHPRSSCAEYRLRHTMSWSAGDKIDVEGAGHDENYEEDSDDEEEEDEEMVAEMCYSEDPLEDFVEAISRMVVRQQLNKAAQLQDLYCRFLRLNAPSLHPTITLAFLHALQRLASFESHLFHTLV